MARNIDVSKTLQNYELVNLEQVTALSKGLNEMVTRRTKLAIEEYESKLTLLKSGDISPEALIAPPKKPRTGKQKKGEEEVTDAEFETND